MESHRKAEAQIPVKTVDKIPNCDFCQKQAHLVCEECATNFCRGCREQHDDKCGAFAKELRIKTKDRALFCAQHANKEASYFCKTCTIFLCRDCLNAYHMHSDIQRCVIIEAGKSILESVGSEGVTGNVIGASQIHTQDTHVSDLPSIHPKANIKKSFNINDLNIDSSCPSKKSKVWIHQHGMKKLKLIDDGGKIRRKIELKFLPNEFIKISDDQMLISSPDDCCLYKLSKDKTVTKFSNLFPYKPLGMAVTKTGDIIVCLVDEWSFDVTSHSKRCLVYLNSTGLATKKEIEFDRYGKRLFTAPHSVEENIDKSICIIDALSGKHGRVCLLDSNGTFKNIYRPSKFYPHGLLCDSHGNILIANSYGNIHVLSAAGQFLCFLLEEDEDLETYPLSMTFSSQGLLWIGCENGKMIISEYRP